MNRRKFLKSRSLFIPTALCFPHIVKAQTFAGSVAVRGAAGLQGAPAGGGGGGGPNTWYDISATSDNTETGDATFFDSEDVVFAQAGTATKARIYIGAYSSDTDVKMALYNNSNTKIAQGTATATVANNLAYLEITFASSVAVTATTYKLAVQANGGGVAYGFLATTGSTYHYHALAYASFPEDPLTAGTLFGTRTLRMGVFVV